MNAHFKKYIKSKLQFLLKLEIFVLMHDFIIFCQFHV